MRFPLTPAGLAADYNVREYPIKSGEAWEIGSLVYADGNEELVECSADPTTVLGVCLAKVSSGDLYGEMAGLSLEAPVVLAEPGTYFWAAGDNDPVATDRHRYYGAAKDSDGIWYVDGTETTTTVFFVVDVDLVRDLYLVRFKTSIMQVTPASS